MLTGQKWVDDLLSRNPVVTLVSVVPGDDSARLPFGNYGEDLEEVDYDPALRSDFLAFTGVLDPWEREMEDAHESATDEYESEPEEGAEEFEDDQYCEDWCACGPGGVCRGCSVPPALEESLEDDLEDDWDEGSYGRWREQRESETALETELQAALDQEERW